MQIGSPCLIDNSKFQYGPKHLSKFYNDTKICSSAATEKKRFTYISYPYRKNSQKDEYLKNILNVPSVVKTELEFCHTNNEAWYRGVILMHQLQLRIFPEQSISKIFNKSGFTDSRQDASEIKSVHIRSIEKKHTKKFFRLHRQLFFFSQSLEKVDVDREVNVNLD